MSAGWKTLENQNSSLALDLSEDEDLTTVRLLEGYSSEAETCHLLD